jgi:hypothetical protein
MTKLSNDTNNDFIENIEKALSLSTSNISPLFLLYDIWKYNENTYPDKYKALYTYFANLFYNELKIIGGAFSVLEKFSNTPLLLFRKDRNYNNDVKESDFFWLPYEVKYYDKNAANLIDTTFLSTRESQRLDKLGPDFLRYINAILAGEGYDFKSFTNKQERHNKLPLIYCDSAEIIIYCLCYIIILEKYKKANSYLANIFSQDHIESLSFDSHDNVAVKSFILENQSDSFFDQFLKKIGNLPETFFPRLDLHISSTPEQIKVTLENLISSNFKITNFSNYDESLGLIHKYARFPIIPYLLIYLFKNDKEDNGNQNIYPCHLVFPVWNSYTFKPNIKLNKEIVTDSKVIFALLTVEDNFYSNSEESYNNFSILSSIIHKLGYITSDTVFYNKFATKSIEKQATRAAISQVMARNTSHNIGAHVMNKLVDSNFLANLNLLDENQFKSYKSETGIEKDKVESDIFKQIANFNNYVKCRMDYLADVTFGTPMMQTNKYAFRDLYKELDKVRLLLENITGLSHFPYKITFTKNGKPLSDEDDLLVAIPNDILGMQAFYNILENIIRNTAKHSKNKPALVDFTVNFRDELDDSLNDALKNEQRKILNDLIIVEVFDNVIVKSDIAAEDNGNPDEQKKYKEILSKQNNVDLDAIDTLLSTKIDWLVFHQNVKINADILEDYKLRTSSLGVIEMDASAAYLRKRDVSYINNDNYNILHDDFCSCNTGNNKGENPKGTHCRNFLKAFRKENTKADYNILHEDGKSETKTERGSVLGYRFFLLRPEVVLVVTDCKEDENWKQSKDELKKAGIWIKSPAKFKEELGEGVVYAHDFVIHDCLSEVKVEIKSKEDSIKEFNILEYYRTSLPLRIIDASKDVIKTKLKGDIAEKENANGISAKTNKKHTVWEEFCWEKWEEKLLKNKNIQCEKENCAKHIIDIGNSINTDVCLNIVLLDHLYPMYSDGKTVDEINKNAREYWEQNSNAFHLEALSSLAQSRLPDFFESSEKVGNDKKLQSYIRFLIKNENSSTYKKLVEAGLSKVIVIDERIQEAADKANNKFMGLLLREQFTKMNVYVPKISLDLGANSYDIKLISEIEKEIKDNITNSETDFIIIHYSILERMYKKEEINKKTFELIGDNKINVIITSGRGVPENMDKRMRFVNLSSIISAFVEIRSKYVINYLLNTSRKIKI